MNKAASRIVIVSAKRTPFGAFGGKLKSMTATDLTVHSTQVIASCPQPSAVATTLSRRLSIHPSIHPCQAVRSAHGSFALARASLWTRRASRAPTNPANERPSQNAHLVRAGCGSDGPSECSAAPHGPLAAASAVRAPLSSLVALQAALAAANVSPELIDTVCVGNVQQTSSDAAYLGRHVALRSGMATRTPALNVNRLCGSGFQSLVSVAHEILLGEARIGVAAGAESMSQAPMAVYGQESLSHSHFPPQVTCMDMKASHTLCVSHKSRVGRRKPLTLSVPPPPQALKSHLPVITSLSPRSHRHLSSLFVVSVQDVRWGTRLGSNLAMVDTLWAGKHNKNHTPTFAHVYTHSPLSLYSIILYMSGFFLLISLVSQPDPLVATCPEETTPLSPIHDPSLST